MVKVIAHARVPDHPHLEEEWHGEEFAPFFKGKYTKYNCLKDLIKHEIFPHDHLDEAFGVDGPSTWSFMTYDWSPLLVIETEKGKFMIQFNIIRDLRRYWHVCAFNAINEESKYVIKLHWSERSTGAFDYTKKIELGIPGDLAAEMVEEAYKYCKKKKLFPKYYHESEKQQLYYFPDQEVGDIIKALKHK